MGQKSSHSSDCFITESGNHVSREEVIGAGAAQARLDDMESPCPFTDSVMLILERGVNWDATPNRIVGSCDEHTND